MQPDGEQEQRHPDLREQLYLVDVPDRGSDRVRPDQDTGEDVAEDQGSPSLRATTPPRRAATRMSAMSPAIPKIVFYFTDLGG